MTEHTPTAEVEHLADCLGPKIVRHETPHRHLLVCSGCSASVAVPRRNEWRDAR